MFRILLISLIFSCTSAWSQNGITSCSGALAHEITSLEQLLSEGTTSQLNIEINNVLGINPDLAIRKKAIDQAVAVLMVGGVATIIDRTGYIYHLEDVAALKNNTVQILQNDISVVDGWMVRTLKFKKVMFEPALHSQSHTAYRPFAPF